MNNLIERYVYDVTRRLPEKEREDVKRELNANILDMLPEEPTDEDIGNALNGMGSPAKLADSYRQTPRCLISPTLYDEYISALKWVLPLVGAIFLIIGVVVGFAQAVREGVAGVDWIELLVSGTISGAIDGLIQAFFWTTVGFAIADRLGHKDEEQWTVDKLPKELPQSKGAIPLSEGIVELVLAAAFTAIGVALLMGYIPIVFSRSAYGSRVMTLFNGDALGASIPVVIIAGVISAAAAILKMIKRRWCVPVCCLSVADDLAGLGAVLYIITKPNVWDTSFIRFMYEGVEGVASAAIANDLASGGSGVLVTATGIIAAVISLICCTVAIIKTVRASRS